MNTIKRITVICFAVIVLAANLPLCASATDPVSAATMANALAQAITAYGASQGVSMTFDVASTDGIGEGVHELWNDFKEDIQDNNVPTYDSLAVTMWADIYTKVGNNIGININDTEMPYIDAFWNWLLSGPAEMTKVDNQYYEWTVSNNVVNPINILSDISASIGNYNFVLCPTPNVSNRRNNVIYSNQFIDTAGNDVYYLSFKNTANYDAVFLVSTSSSTVYRICLADGNTYDSTRIYLNQYGNSGIYYSTAPWLYPSTSATLITSPPNYDSSFTIANFEALLQSGSSLETSQNNISVQPYIGDTTPDRIYIPDNEDVNYTPLPYVGGLDIPWDDSLFGDGSGTLTDAQSEAITGVVDDAITDSLEKTITLADTENPDIPAPNEVYIPLLPVELPSFNFSLSGIWHYVVSWVQSLSAWFSLMFQTWAVLPSAITIPVYATAVIVIVLGVYKRFFM